MRIHRLDIHHLRLPLRTPWHTSLGTEDAVETVLIHAYTKDADAWVETCPLSLPTYSPEYAAGVARLTARVLAPHILGQELPQPGSVHDLLSPFRGNPFAKAGLDNAWWALHATIQDQPLHDLIGGSRREVRLGEGIGIERDLHALSAKVAALAEQNFARIKLKVTPGWDIEPLRHLRGLFPELPLMIDCNGAYTPDLHTPLFKDIDTLNLLMIEQPFAPPSLAEHAALQNQLRTPICLDESIASLADAQAALAAKACRIINIKPGRVGGITPAVAIHDLCLAQHIPCWIGGMLETGIGASINLALATLPGCTLPTVNLSSDRWYTSDIVQEHLSIGPNAAIIPACQSFIGREVDEGLVAQLSLARETITM